MRPASLAAPLPSAGAGATLANSSGRAMGSPLRLTTVGAADPDGAWRTVVTEFAAAEAVMTRFRADSDLSRLNANAGDGRPVTIDRRLARAVIASDRATRVTAGRFDARVVVDLERLGDMAVPQSSPLAAGGRGTRQRVVRSYGRDGRLAIDDPLDLGGIGKGLALRWARDGLDAAGLPAFLLDAGGDLVARGSAPDGPWLIAIEDPAGRDDGLAVIAVHDLAVATSSTRRRRWLDGGREVHHLIDPGSGEPAVGGLSAVTVAGPDPAWAEVWSKALFVSGRRAIGPTARARGLAAWWVTDEGGLEMTPAARRLTVWVASESERASSD